MLKNKQLIKLWPQRRQLESEQQRLLKQLIKITKRHDNVRYQLSELASVTEIYDGVAIAIYGEKYNLRVSTCDSCHGIQGKYNRAAEIWLNVTSKPRAPRFGLRLSWSTKPFSSRCREFSFGNQLRDWQAVLTRAKDWAAKGTSVVAVS